MKEFTIHHLDEIREVARRFLDAMENRTVFAFRGTMGAGKTTFIKALCEELGVQDVINSPTFAIVNEYGPTDDGRLIYHFDFYRINKPEEAYDFGYEDYIYSDAASALSSGPRKSRSCCRPIRSMSIWRSNPTGRAGLSWNNSLKKRPAP